MAESQYISKGKPVNPSMDYHELREAGLEHIRKSAAAIWTDYNIHDPGITMLELLCYAITDLGYRCNHPIEDILASDPENRIGTSPDFYLAHEILPAHPLTIKDFRKILIDLPFIRNAWIEPNMEPEPVLYYKPESGKLGYSGPGEEIHIKGLYDVKIEFARHTDFGDLNSNTAYGEIISKKGLKKISFPFEILFPAYSEAKHLRIETENIKEIKSRIREVNEKGLHYEVQIKITGQEPGHSETINIGIRFLVKESLLRRNAGFLKRELKKVLEDKREDSHLIIFKKKIAIIGTYLEQTAAYLHERRNLCEDFLSAGPISTQEIAIEATIEIPIDCNPAPLLAQMFFDISQFIDPSIRFYSLEEMLKDGMSPEEIFEGPLLKHGFIRNENLEPYNNRDAIYSSDILRIMMASGNNKVIAVKGLKLRNYISGNPVSGNALDCLFLFRPDIYKPKLSVSKSQIIVRKRGIPVPEDQYKEDEIIAIYNDLMEKAEPDKVHENDHYLDIAHGTDRRISEYTSIQEDFPPVYGIGSAGLPSSMTAERGAKARQLKGYLLFFDQLLANFLSQLSNVRNLFSFDPGIKRTYFNQTLKMVPDAMFVIREFIKDQPDPGDKEAINIAWKAFIDNDNNYQNHLDDLTETQDVFRDRRNRFLDHLIARFCEDFTDYSLHLLSKDKNEMKDDLIRQKVSFLQGYKVLGKERGKAYSLKNPGDVPWDTDNISGTEKRISAFLGFTENKRRFLTDTKYHFIEFYQEEDIDSIDEYRFRIRNENDKILLSSTKHYKILESGYIIIYEVLSSAKNPANYSIHKASNGKFYFTLLDKQDQLIAMRKEMFDTAIEAQDAIDEAVRFFNLHFRTLNDKPQEGFHLIEHLIIRPQMENDPLLDEIRDDFDRPSVPGRDPYSYRTMVVFPRGIDMFEDPNARNLAEFIARMEMPAHIMPYVYFADNISLSRFEVAYRDWLMWCAKPFPEDPAELTEFAEKRRTALKQLIAAMQFLPELPTG